MPFNTNDLSNFDFTTFREREKIENFRAQFDSMSSLPNLPEPLPLQSFVPEPLPTFVPEPLPLQSFVPEPLPTYKPEPVYTLGRTDAEHRRYMVGGHMLHMRDMSPIRRMH